MAYQPRPGDATLFKNDKENRSEKAPVLSGKVVAHRDIQAGETLSLAFWRKEGARGPFYSGRMDDLRDQAPKVFQRQEMQPEPLDDDIPF